jgi:hypothetical protein
LHFLATSIAAGGMSCFTADIGGRDELTGAATVRRRLARVIIGTADFFAIEAALPIRAVGVLAAGRIPGVGIAACAEIRNAGLAAAAEFVATNDTTLTVVTNAPFRTATETGGMTIPLGGAAFAFDRVRTAFAADRSIWRGQHLRRGATIAIDTGFVFLAALVDQRSAADPRRWAALLSDAADTGLPRRAALPATEIVGRNTLPVAALLSVGAAAVGAGFRAAVPLDIACLTFGATFAVEAGALEGTVTLPRLFATTIGTTDVRIGAAGDTGIGTRIALVTALTKVTRATAAALTKTALATA